MNEQEPTNWELWRAVVELRKSVDAAVAGMVTQATLAIYQQAQKERDDRQDVRLRELEDQRTDDRKARQQQWVSIGLVALASIGSFVVGIALRGGV